MEWRAIPGWEGIFEVSSGGMVRSLARTVERGGTPLRMPGRVLRPATTTKGYRQISLRADGRLQTVGIHRLVAEVFCPARSAEQTQVNHKDSDRTNNHYTNLEWCTAAENSRHALEKGLRLPRRNKALSTEDATKVYDAYTHLGVAASELAKQYGVSVSTIARVVARSTWAHLPVTAARSSDGWIQHLEEENSRLRALNATLVDEMDGATNGADAHRASADRQKAIALARADALEAEAGAIRRAYASAAAAQHGDG